MSLQRLLVGLAAACAFSAQAEHPVAFSHTQPVSPGQTVMVQGHAFVENNVGVQVRLRRLSDVGNVPQPVVQIAPTKIDAANLYFTLPADLQQGVFQYRLATVGGDRFSGLKYINKPEPWFLHGNRGDRATQGGWIAVYGNSLSLSTARSAKLRMSGTGLTTVVLNARASSGNRFVQYFDLPETLAPGSYKIEASNGFGDAAGWTAYESYGTVPITEFTVVEKDWGWEKTASLSELTVQPNTTYADCNIAPTDYWDNCLFSMLNSVGSNGAKLKFPAGTYKLQRTLVLPDKVIVSGAGKGLSTLHWPVIPLECVNGSFRKYTAYQQDKADGNRPLVRGAGTESPYYWRATFSMEHITLYQETRDVPGNRCTGDAGFKVPNQGIQRGYTDNGGADRSGRFESIEVKMPNTETDSQLIAADAGNNYHKLAAFWLRSSRNTQIVDSTFDAPAGLMFVTNNGITSGVPRTNSHTRVENNTIRWRYVPFDTQAATNLVYARNKVVMLGVETLNGTSSRDDIGESIASFDANNMRDLYHGENKYTRDAASGAGDVPHPQLGTTLDGMQGVYSGFAVSATGTQLSLAGNTSEVQPHGGGTTERAVLGASVQILAGRGAGQQRYLASPVSTPSTQVQVDKAWDVAPDATSWVTITQYFGRFIFFRNEFGNAPKVQAFYFSNDVIFAENTFGSAYTPGVVSTWSGDHRLYVNAANAAGWRLQVLDNKMQGALRLIGNNYTQPQMTPTELDQAQRRGIDPNYVGAQARMQVYRNNATTTPGLQVTLEPGTRTDGVLAENNVGVKQIRLLPNSSAPMQGLIKNNLVNLPLAQCGSTATPDCAFSQIAEKDTAGYNYPLPLTNAPFDGILLTNPADGVFNVASSGMASASGTGAGTWERIFLIDGDINNAGVAGHLNQPWLQVDTRLPAAIQKLVLWPKPATPIADLVVIVGPNPLTGTLDQERNNPVNTVWYVNGTLASPTTLEPQPGQTVVGRYVRVWKSYPTGTTGGLTLGELQVYGSFID